MNRTSPQFGQGSWIGMIIIALVLLPFGWIPLVQNIAEQSKEDAFMATAIEVGGYVTEIKNNTDDIFNLGNRFNAYVIIVDEDGNLPNGEEPVVIKDIDSEIKKYQGEVISVYIQPDNPKEAIIPTIKSSRVSACVRPAIFAILSVVLVGSAIAVIVTKKKQPQQSLYSGVGGTYNGYDNSFPPPPGSNNGNSYGGGTYGQDNNNGFYTGQDNNNGFYTGQDNNNGFYNGQDNNNGFYTGQDNNNGFYTGQDNNNGFYNGQDNNNGFYTGQDNNNGFYTGQDNNNGFYNGQDNNNGFYTGQDNNNGFYSGQDNNQQ